MRGELSGRSEDVKETVMLLLSYFDDDFDVLLGGGHMPGRGSTDGPFT